MKAAIRKAIGVKVVIGDAALKRNVQVLSPSRVAVTVVGSSVSFPCMTILSKTNRICKYSALRIHDRSTITKAKRTLHICSGDANLFFGTFVIFKHTEWIWCDWSLSSAV